MTHIVMGLLLIVLAYLIRYRKWSWLIVGYNTSSKEEKKKYNKEALCNGVGNLLFILSGIAFVAALGEFWRVGWIVSFSWVLFSIVILVVIIYMNTGNRFKN
ncbi:DUF3784 domain-containing protein [Halonatronum saccharophilum]|uniref:DUF3784 domain-containing protein n=1 Tax=Halonatronum saccharophilum TaxID=150060 RepID=UPI0004AD5588|nr:DUF3784 domain-containing protein [Halonatronum saccharophilum]